MEGQYAWNFSPWQTNLAHEQTKTVEYGKDNRARFSVSPILPGTGNVTHNVTCMTGRLPNGNIDSTYSPDQFMSFRNNLSRQNNSSHDTDFNHENSESNVSASDMSTSTERSISPYSSSSITPPPTNGDNLSMSNTPYNVNGLSLAATPPNVDSSSRENMPSSVASSPSDESFSSRSPSPSDTDIDNATSKKRTGGQSTKKSRTNFTNEQIKSLLKIFCETPYPDSEMMENIAKDLNITEKQVKIWFQNKRARSRRRMNDNNQHTFFPTSPTPFGYMPVGHMMTSSPLQNYPFNYHMMQGYLGHYNNKQLVGQMIANQNLRHHQIANQNLTLSGQATSASSVQTMSSAQYGRTIPQQISPNQNRQLSQYPGYMYASK